MPQALYRKYRSRSFDELVGQGHITATLQNALKLGKISHAYLFTGPRGVGKTSVARILAHAINELPYSDTPHLDIIEIDAASNRRIEDVRDLREKVHIAPTSAKYKVYIIDEVHMLTNESFNALLKTLEEPPAHVVFILATTELHKLPATITSRTQRFAFAAPSQAVIAAHLAQLAKQDGIAIETAALELIAEHADGSFRDSISLLDQSSTLGDGKKPVTEQAVAALLGVPPREELQKLLASILSRKPAEAADHIKRLETAGVSSPAIASGLMRVAISKAAHEPVAARLLGSLADVTRSSYPTAKLLSVVLMAAHNDGAQQATVPKRTPAVPLVSQAAPTIVAAPPARPVSKKAATAATVKPATPPAAITSTAPFDVSGVIDCWGDILEALKLHSAPLSGALKNAEVRAGDGGSLLLVFKSAFHSRKITDAKHKQAFAIALNKITGMGGVEIITDVDAAIVPTPLNSKPISPTPEASSVIDVMGGGQAVRYTD